MKNLQPALINALNLFRSLRTRFGSFAAIRRGLRLPAKARRLRLARKLNRTSKLRKKNLVFDGSENASRKVLEPPSNPDCARFPRPGRSKFGGRGRLVAQICATNRRNPRNPFQHFEIMCFSGRKSNFAYRRLLRSSGSLERSADKCPYRLNPRKPSGERKTRNFRHRGWHFP